MYAPELLYGPPPGSYGSDIAIPLFYEEESCAETEPSTSEKIWEWLGTTAHPAITSSCKEAWVWLTETDGGTTTAQATDYNKSFVKKTWEWFTTSGDPQNIRPARWKRLAVLHAAFAAYLLTRSVTDDAQLIVNSGTFFTVQAHAELYDRSRLTQGVFLVAMTGAVWTAHHYVYPNVSFLTQAALPALSMSLGWRTATMATQAWMNKKAVLRA